MRGYRVTGGGVRDHRGEGSHGRRYSVTGVSRCGITGERVCGVRG